MRIFAIFSLLLSGACATSRPAFAIDLEKVEAELKSSGAKGWIHGSVDSEGLYVFTYRSPTNFFDFVQLSLTSSDPAIVAQFKNFARHDQVLIKGSFLNIPIPQKHIEVTSIEAVKIFDPGFQTGTHQYEATPQDLLNKTSETFMVHAVAAGGQILVVEYRDAIVPIFVKNGALTKDLWRGDIVQLSYRIQSYPDQPIHLRLNETDPKAVQVLEAIKARDGQQVTIEGNLVFFPKSPEINLNVFAVEEISHGFHRQLTLVNFDDMEILNAIFKKCQDAWDRHPGDFTNGRNKYVANHIRVKAKGIFNEVDPGQANAQILLTSPSDIEITELNPKTFR